MPATATQLAASSALSLVLLAIGLVGTAIDNTPARAVGLGLFAIWGVGSAAMTLLGEFARGMYSMLCVAIGLAVTIVVATLMVEVSAWHPVVLGVIVAAVAVALHLRLLVRFLASRRVS